VGQNKINYGCVVQNADGSKRLDKGYNEKNG